MGVQIKIVVVLLTENTALLSQSHELFKPASLILGHFIKDLFFSGFSFPGNFVTLLIEVESTSLGKELFDIA